MIKSLSVQVIKKTRNKIWPMHFFLVHHATWWKQSLVFILEVPPQGANFLCCSRNASWPWLASFSTPLALCLPPGATFAISGVWGSHAKATKTKTILACMCVSVWPSAQTGLSIEFKTKTELGFYSFRYNFCSCPAILVCINSHDSSNPSGSEFLFVFFQILFLMASKVLFLLCVDLCIITSLWPSESRGA